MPDTVSSSSRWPAIASAHPQATRLPGTRPPRSPATSTLRAEGKPRQPATAIREHACTDGRDSIRSLSVAEERWRVEVTRRGLTPLSVLLPEVAGAWDDLDDWLDGEDIPDGVPFLISPGLEYDTDLNQYFLRPAMVGSSRNTQLAAAGDVRRFLDFLWCPRDGKGWRDATEADHDAYWFWRRQDPGGPRVAGSTWNRELSMLNGFYGWAARRGLVAASPIAQRQRRPLPGPGARRLRPGRSRRRKRGTLAGIWWSG